MAKHAADGKIITVNRQARHNYFVLEAFEAGIELTGTEVKSIRAGGVNEVLRQVESETEEKMNAISGGLNIPGLF